jgi:2-polyprenyl-3-methyl-5-hydroxy-6-metoxy-1,4-benzoquinol methylase
MVARHHDEVARLEAIARDSWYAKGANGASVQYCAKVFERFWRGSRCLELGPAEGLMSEQLAARFPELTLVEGSGKFCEELCGRFPTTKVVHSLFEDYRPEVAFDTIILGHVLEHVENPRELLRKVGGWLAEGGVLCAGVPNSRSLHRQAAVIMGLLPREDALNESDLHHGHRRVYDPESFRAEFLAAGLKLHCFGGYWLKPLATSQIDAHWTPEMLAAFMSLGERYPDVAGEIYVIAGR